MAVFFRVFIGLVLLASGFEKLLSHYQNFLYVIQAYEIFPAWLEKTAALSVPWVELLIGLFLVLGLWLQWSLKGALVLFGCFIVIVGQALLRHLPIDQCGCFGEAIHILPQYILVFDSLMLLILFALISQPAKTQVLSLDKYFK
jgi:uncharacterized membrane protein YphA (DoxX/SURF4 family)